LEANEAQNKSGRMNGLMEWKRRRDSKKNRTLQWNGREEEEEQNVAMEEKKNKKAKINPTCVTDRNEESVYKEGSRH